MTGAVGVNRVLLVGAISGGPWHNRSGEGRAESCAFSLQVPEPGRDGEIYRTFVRCECYGRAVPDALALHGGDTVLVEGKLSWQRGSGEGKAGLCVTAWRVLKLARGLTAAG